MSDIAGTLAKCLSWMPHIVLFGIPLVFGLFIFLGLDGLHYYNIWLLDPSYAYYVNMVKVRSEFWPGLVEHPGIPLEMFGGALLYLFDLSISGSCIHTDCIALFYIENAERYISIISGIIVVIFCASLTFLGVVIYRVNKDIFAASSVQLIILALPTTIAGLLPLAPEAALLSLCILIVSMLISKDDAPTPSASQRLTLGALIATAISLKLTALPYMFLTILGANRRNASIAIVGAVALFAAWILLALPQIDRTLGFYSRFALHAGIYGYGENIGAFDKYLNVVNNISIVFSALPTEITVFTIIVFFSLMCYIRGINIPSIVSFTAVAGLAMLVLLLRQPVPRYFLPMIPLLAIGAGWVLTSLAPLPADGKRATSFSRAAIAAALVVGVLLNVAHARAKWESWVTYNADFDRVIDVVSSRYSCYVMRGNNSQTAIYFGLGWARSAYLNELLENRFPDYITYNHSGRGELYDFSGKLAPIEIENKRRHIGQQLCAVFPDAWTPKIDEEFYDVLEHLGDYTAVRVHEPIVR